MKPASHPNSSAKPEIETREELIDTYELFAGIFKESGGHYSFIPKLDATLPLIYGKPDLVRNLFCQFLTQYLLDSTTSGNHVLISHTKDRRYWIFNLQIFNSTAELIPLPSLVIQKSSVQPVYSNYPY